jgi:hypothetical protein
VRADRPFLDRKDAVARPSRGVDSAVLLNDHVAGDGPARRPHIAAIAMSDTRPSPRHCHDGGAIMRGKPTISSGVKPGSRGVGRRRGDELHQEDRAGVQTPVSAVRESI